MLTIARRIIAPVKNYIYWYISRIIREAYLIARPNFTRILSAAWKKQSQRLKQNKKKLKKLAFYEEHVVYTENNVFRGRKLRLEAGGRCQDMFTVVRFNNSVKWT